MRAVILNRLHRVDMSEALGSVLVERLIDIATLALVGFSAARLLGAPAWIVQVLGVAAGIGAIGLVVLLTIGLQPMLRMARRLGLINRPGFANIATRFVTTLGGHSRRGALLAAFAVSVATWLLDATSFWLAGRSVGVDLPYSAAMIVSAISVLGTAVPSAPGYVGTFELAAAGTAGALGIPSSEALALAVVVHTMTLIPLALAGAASLISINVKLGDVARAAEARRDG